MEQSVYNQNGQKADTVTLPEALFAQDLRPDMLHRVVEAARYNQRQPVAHTKDRRERRGGGKKPWRQKGTGRARHGSIRSPLWRKGGVTFGPKRDRQRKRKVNKKEKQAGLASALSAKRRDGEVLLVDEMSFDEPSTAQAKEIITSLGDVQGFSELPQRRENAAVLIVPEKEENMHLSFRNFGNIAMITADDVHALDLLTYRYAIIVDPETVFETIEDRISDKAS